MHDLTRLLRRAFAQLLLLSAWLGSPTWAALDATSLTDDHSINTPTAWWVYGNQTPQALRDRIEQHDARIAGLDVESVTASGEPRFAARLVRNQGAYRAAAWWWYHDQTPEQITAHLNANTARLIEVKRYDRGGGQIRYAVVMVSNQGSAARTWSYLLGATRAQLAAHMRTTNARPIDLDGYGEGSTRRYNAVFVSNTGADARAFDWDVDVPLTEVQARLAGFGGRLVKFGRSGDRCSFVQVRNTAADNSAWWHRLDFATMKELENYSRQMGARPIDVASRLAGLSRRYDAVFIDNANAEERRMRPHFARFVDAQGSPRGIFGAYLKRVDGPVLINLNGERPAEVASAFKVVHLLHAMRQVMRGLDQLSAADFKYYNYYYDTDNEQKDRCPIPSQENAMVASTITLREGLQWMMADSDNRTTRGVVLRYGGGFEPFNATAARAGLDDTTLRHNLGCAYRDPSNDWTYSPQALRNLTTLRDLASVYEGVQTARLLGNAQDARADFLTLANYRTTAGDELRTLVFQEAFMSGKLRIAQRFIDNIRTWGKGGKYGTCLGDPANMTECGQGVQVYSYAGMIELPFVLGDIIDRRRYVHGALVSDVPKPSDDDGATAKADKAAYNNARYEMLRGVIREALATW